ncbi:hypothetical protein NDI56_11515 [Haloarcula sp. S1CR25-12]|uniref:Serine/threonine protein kinase n=1 Tax=Haloarcula saliterrae TaxID=2950534 RepID=A0ABU2FCN2_9EURY|nr:hypothetical protein [Haloarcula sp. S1CR25-12]MDS0260022.1 hypothetical protein [Haloarcula sp. S1CR25-12]
MTPTVPTDAQPREYTVFDRRVRSSIRLPSLREPGDSGHVGPEIRIDRGSLPADPTEIPDPSTRVYADPEGEFTVHETASGTFYWFYDGVGTLRIRDGRELTLSPVPESTAAARRRFVRGPGLRSALVQQGAVVLHASAVVIDGRAVAFAGPSGRGKSTTAGAFLAAGHDLLTDDVLPCDPAGRPVVPSGAPSLSVDARASAALGLGQSSEATAEVAVEDRFAAGTYPLAAVYLLTDGADVDIERLSAQRGVFGLLKASYAIYRATDRTAQQAHLDACGTLADAVDVCRLTRPRSLDALETLVARVERDLAERPAPDSDVTPRR